MGGWEVVGGASELLSGWWHLIGFLYSYTLLTSCEAGQIWPEVSPSPCPPWPPTGCWCSAVSADDAGDHDPGTRGDAGHWHGPVSPGAGERRGAPAAPASPPRTRRVSSSWWRGPPRSWYSQCRSFWGSGTGDWRRVTRDLRQHSVSWYQASESRPTQTLDLSHTRTKF